MNKIPCKYFDYGRGTCKFGLNCYYAHVDQNGRLLVQTQRNSIPENSATEKRHKPSSSDLKLGMFLLPPKNNKSKPQQNNNLNKWNINEHLICFLVFIFTDICLKSSESKAKKVECTNFDPVESFANNWSCCPLHNIIFCFKRHTKQFSNFKLAIYSVLREHCRWYSFNRSYKNLWNIAFLQH
jgi:hypothetical protein